MLCGILPILFLSEPCVLENPVNFPRNQTANHNGGELFERPKWTTLFFPDQENSHELPDTE